MLVTNFLTREPLNIGIISAFLINLLAHLFQGSFYHIVTAPFVSAHHHQLQPGFQEHSSSVGTKNVANAFLGLRSSLCIFSFN